MKNGDRITVCSGEDVRNKNRQLAIKMIIRELKKLNNSEVNLIFEKWSLIEIEHGDVLSLGMDFPEDVERFQWFYENDLPVLKFITPKKPELAPL